MPTASNRSTQPKSDVRVGVDRATQKPFANFGDFLKSVRAAAHGDWLNGATDPRLLPLAGTPSGMNSNVGSEGGFLVQPEYANGILDRAYTTGAILSRVMRYGVSPSRSGVKLPAWDETSRADGQRLGGARAYWAEDADQATASKPKLRDIELNLKKLLALFVVTEELEEDAPGFSPLVMNGFAKELTFALENAIFTGYQGGVIGLLQQKAQLIVQTKDAAQATATFSATNAANMASRIFMSNDPSGVAWLCHQDVYAQILTLSLGTGSAFGPLFVPYVGGDAAAPYGRLAGRPVLPVEYCSALGTLGDVVHADLSQYIVADREANQAVSIHVYFLTGQNAYRISYRVAGQPIWSQKVTPLHGSNQVSPTVVLEAR
jgi:HK97 family phage major capsid protein